MSITKEPVRDILASFAMAVGFELFKQVLGRNLETVRFELEQFFQSVFRKIFLCRRMDCCVLDGLMLLVSHMAGVPNSWLSREQNTLASSI